MSKRCKYGKLKHPHGNRRCKTRRGAKAKRRGRRGRRGARAAGVGLLTLAALGAGGYFLWNQVSSQSSASTAAPVPGNITVSPS